MGISPHFDLEKVLFLAYLPSEMSKEVASWHVYLVGVVDVLSGCLDFSASF